MDKEKFIETVEGFRNNDNFLYGSNFELSDRNIKLDCLGFVIAVYETINSKILIPRFSMSNVELKEIIPESFNKAVVGDVILFFIKGRNEKRGYQRSYHHLALKYSNTEIAHMGKKGDSVRIESFEKYKNKENMITQTSLS